jgi:hypothetical protein
LDLAANAASVALQYGFVAQGEALLRLALSLLQDATPLTVQLDGTVTSNHVSLRDAVGSLITIGAATPSHAKHGHLYVITSVLAWNDGFTWPVTSPGKIGTYAAILRSVSRALLAGQTTVAYPRCMTDNYIKDHEYLAAGQSILTKAALSAAAWTREQSQNPTHSPDALCSGAVDLLQTAAFFGDASSSLPVRECSAECWQLLAKYAAGSSSGGASVEVTRVMASLPHTVDRMCGHGVFAALTDLHAARAARRRQQDDDDAEKGCEDRGAVAEL